MREKVEIVLNKIKTSLSADRGGVELVDVKDGVVKLKLTGACSGCPMAAMTLQNAAYVRALGQIELLFAFAVSYLVFRERSSSWELFGIVLVTIGILALVLWN